MSTPPPAGPTPSPEMTAAALPPLAGPSSPASSAGGSVKDEQQMRDSSPAPATSVKKDESDAEGEDAADLFGDDDDEDDADAKPDDDTKMAADGREGSAQASQNGGEEDEPMFSDNDSITSSVRERRVKLEYAEDGSDDGSVGRAPVDQEKFSAQLGAMTWEAHEGTDGKRWLLRLPKTVHHQHMPYSRDLYQEPDDPVLPELLEEDVQLTANEIERRKAEELMRQVGSTIRWRWTKDAEGRPVKQPNARIVKWSDGSLSLQLGKPTNMFSLVSHPDPSYPAAPQSYLVNHHWDAELMQTEGMYAGHMTLVPVGMEGEAHRILAKGVKERNREKSRMKMWDDDSMTASNVDIPGVKKARAKSVRGPREDNGGGSSRKKAVRSAAAAAGRGRRGSIYSDDSESELDDEEERRRRRRLSAGGGKAGASARDADDGGGYANDGFVVSDDDEEEDSRARSRSSKGKSKRRASPTLSSSEEEAEALESEEASSEEDARSRKRSKGGKEKRREREASIESEEMDSEDDDDGPGAGEIKKRRVVIADEDEEE